MEEDTAECDEEYAEEMSLLDESMNMSAYDINLDEIEAWQGDEEYFQKEEETLKTVVQKEEEIGRMLELTEQFHNTIDQLKSEISNLQQDKVRLTKLQEKQAHAKAIHRGFGGGPTSSATAILEENKVKKELRDKCKLLEDKMKELKLKEMQYSSTVAQKDKAIREVDTLKKVLL